jgi:hypothetical protein
MIRFVRTDATADVGIPQFAECFADVRISANEYVTRFDGTAEATVECSGKTRDAVVGIIDKTGIAFVEITGLCARGGFASLEGSVSYFSLNATATAGITT